MPRRYMERGVSISRGGADSPFFLKIYELNRYSVIELGDAFPGKEFLEKKIETLNVGNGKKRRTAIFSIKIKYSERHGERAR